MSKDRTANSDGMTECGTCGKRYIIPPGSIYKLTIDHHVQHYCCYSCYTKGQQKKARLSKAKKKNQHM